MNKFLRCFFLTLFSFVSICVVAQRRISLPNSSLQRLAHQNPHTTVFNSYYLDYTNAELNCIGVTDQYYIWKLNTNGSGTDTLDLKEAGEIFNSWVDANSCANFATQPPFRVASLDWYYGYSNYSSQMDTIVFYIEATSSTTQYPNGNILWSDTIFRNTPMSSANSWLMDDSMITLHPNIFVNGAFFAGVRYYGNAADTFGILADEYPSYVTSSSSYEASYGKALRIQRTETNWRPDTLNNDYFYDSNANGIYDLGLGEAFPFQTTAVWATLEDSSVEIDGYVYKDLNGNNIWDNGEPPRVNTLVSAGNFSATTDAFGYFQIFSDTGNYNVQPIIQGYFTVSTSPVNVAAYSYTQVYHTGNFATNDIPNVHDLRVDATRDICYVPGYGGDMIINYENFGTVTMNGLVKYVPDPIAGIGFENPTHSSSNADTLIWNFTNLLPGETRQIYLYDTIPASTTLGTLLHYYSEIQPIAGDSVPQDNFVAVTDTAVGSFDPNEKTPFPSGIGQQGNISPTQKLTYLVRFQNTGTYPAQTVIVRDTLDSDLDIKTFNFVSSSFPCTWSISSERVVTFTFLNILLADSNSNEPASHGFLKYSILPDTGLAPGTQLTNTAYIYFDYNSPVVTNTTLNTIATPNGTEEISFAGNNISVFPNPFSDAVTIKWNADAKEQPTKLLLFDISGRMVKTISVTSNQVEIERENLESGLYFFQLETYSGKKFAVGKIIAR
jgi:uncharacterized repeat protein (TIGR01451 family)